MPLAIGNISFDCTDALAVAQFWSAALGRPVDDGGSADFAAIDVAQRRPGAPGWMFTSVPESKQAKNRMHLDLTAADRPAEVARLIELGATHVDDHDEWGHQWSVLRDPEGNEFCVASAG